jgi:hypothetical protein
MDCATEPMLWMMPATLADVGEIFWPIMGGIAVLWLILSFVQKTVKMVTRERTRREIAAYIAEGSMTPEQGERLMKAGEFTEPDQKA